MVISTCDKAQQLRLSEDCLTLTGDKGYCTARATHGVAAGTWYYEVTILEPETPTPSRPLGHTRIGWAQQYCNLQVPCGFDSYSYSWRDVQGTFFHNSKGMYAGRCEWQRSYSMGLALISVFARIHPPLLSSSLLPLPPPPFPPCVLFSGRDSAREAYGPGDVLGFLIDLPDKHGEKLIPPPIRLDSVVDLKGRAYIEEKDSPDVSKVRPLPGSRLLCYKNGVFQGTMRSDINEGTYYPAFSMYYGASIRVNFGPEFEFPPADVSSFRPLSDAVYVHNSILTLGDIVGKVSENMETGVCVGKGEGRGGRGEGIPKFHSYSNHPHRLKIEAGVATKPTTSAVTADAAAQHQQQQQQPQSQSQLQAQSQQPPQQQQLQQQQLS